MMQLKKIEIMIDELLATDYEYLIKLVKNANNRINKNIHF